MEAGTSVTLADMSEEGSQQAMVDSARVGEVGEEGNVRWMSVALGVKDSG